MDSFDKIGKQKLVIAEYCHKKVNYVSDREKKFSYINLLFKANPSLAFKLYKEWIITNRQIPDQVYRLNDLRSEQIDDYIDIYEDALKLQVFLIPGGVELFYMRVVL